MSPERISRRKLLVAGAIGGVAIVAGTGGYELIERGDLPGRYALDRLTGACDVGEPDYPGVVPGPVVSGRFYSQYRQREVGWSIAFPNGYRPDDELPAVFVLHGLGGNHSTAFTDLKLQYALSSRIDGRRMPPAALVSVDGGDGYWLPHLGDDPHGLLVYELLPFCQHRGLARKTGTLGVYGWSMGGYGALLFAEGYKGMVGAVVAESPALFGGYFDAHEVAPQAFASPADYYGNDVISRIGRLVDIPVKIDIGKDDPYASLVGTLRGLPLPWMQIHIDPGCHDDNFWRSHGPSAMEFLTTRIGGKG